MSKKKSLGSSPIGYSSLGDDSFDFIPSIDISIPEKDTHTGESPKGGAKRPEAELSPSEPIPAVSDNSDDNNTHHELSSTKKIASYSLEEHVVERIKVMAEEQKTYYSSVVSSALKFWLNLHGH